MKRTGQITPKTEITWQEMKEVIRKNWNIEFLFESDGNTCEVKGRSNTNIIEAKSRRDITGRRHVVRILPLAAHLDRHRQTCHWLTTLRNSQLYSHAPLPLPTSDNGYYVMCHGQAISLYEYQEGETLHLWETPSPDLLKAIATECRHLNQGLKQLPIAGGSLVNEEEELLQLVTPSQWSIHPSIRALIEEGYPLFKRNVDHLLLQKKRLFEEKGFTPQWVHGDIHQENILVHPFEGGRISGILDFEECHIGYEMTDVIFTALRICKTDKTAPQMVYQEGAISFFLKEYDKGYETRAWEIYHEDSNFWKRYFALQQSLLYMRHAYHHEWTLSQENGFLQCFNSVVNN